MRDPHPHFSSLSLLCSSSPSQAESVKWYSRAQLALEKGEEDLAREALARRQQQLELADSLKGQVEGNANSITSLYDSMKELEAKVFTLDTH